MRKTKWTDALLVVTAINFGTGNYTNLCDSGTAANFYSCDPGCNPQTGICESTNQGVVRYVCTGKWNQCLESESDWSNQKSLGTPGCEKTVQLSLFDKKCRREDLTWDTSCNLLGYMVWYSGECSGGGTQPTQVPGSPTPTPKSKFGGTLTPTVQSNVGKVCGATCGENNACAVGFACVNGVCRNPSCETDASCFCGQVEGAITDTTPETGVGTWVGVVAMVGMGALGWKTWKLGRKLWK